MRNCRGSCRVGIPDGAQDEQPTIAVGDGLGQKPLIQDEQPTIPVGDGPVQPTLLLLQVEQPTIPVGDGLGVPAPDLFACDVIWQSHRQSEASLCTPEGICTSSRPRSCHELGDSLYNDHARSPLDTACPWEQAIVCYSDADHLRERGRV